MPMLVLLGGRPVKKKVILPDGRIKAWFYAPGVGDPGEEIILPQEEWQRKVTRQYFPAETMPDVRAMAAAG